MGTVTKIDFGRHVRPRPPRSLMELEDPTISFVPAPELSEWFRAVFIEPGGPLYNPEHDHLQSASIGALWTRVSNSRAGRTVLGMAEPGDPRAMGKWAKARAVQQVEGWFGRVPDFVMTIFADYADLCGDAEFCALIEHELMHMAQELDEFGAPKFRKNGLPAFTMRGHDVEEFVGIVARYGATATGVADLVEAANKGPTVGLASIARACGTCLERRSTG